MKALKGRRMRCTGMAAALLAAGLGVGTAQADKKDEALLKELKTSGHRLVWATSQGVKEAKSDLYVSNADGSEPVNITNTPDLDEGLPRVNWKTGRIAFVAEGGRLSFVDLDGKNLETSGLEKVVDKDWSPDGAKLAVTSDRKSFGFRIYDPKTKKVESFAKDKQGIIDIDWGPDGKRMAFATRKELGFRYTILTMNTDGTDIRPFCRGGDNQPYCHPCWHPTEMRIAWNSRQGLLVGDYDPKSNDGQAKDMKALLTEKQVGWEDPCPRWSPDGRYIAWLTKGRRLHVVRVSDSASTALGIPESWKVDSWEYDWAPMGAKGGAQK